ncbi:hypothetical protein JXM67_09650 [candidate division WOR-3 bacterium]|nr:hypothetical protein [candidate division WOR-3 bacterium]
MVPKAKHTGSVLEQTVIPILQANDYEVQNQVFIGEKIGGGRHRVDVIAKAPGGDEILISLKWQQTGGTTQEKIPYEAIKLIHAIKTSNERFDRAYIVLGGEGMDKGLKEFYLSGGLSPYIVDYNLVNLVSLDRFIALANKKVL